MELAPEISQLSDYISKEIDKGFELLNLQEYLRDFDLSSVDFSFVQFDEHQYKRNLVFRDHNIDVVFIGWGSGHASAIHDHPENFCIVRIIKNELTEEIYLNRGEEKVEKQTTKKLKEGGITHIRGKAVVHRICNFSEEKTISLHIYSPPNYKTNYYVSY